jgi:type 2 lantibiotic biosynthesis protein LanM
MNDLKNEWLFGFATSIKERISVLPQDEYPDTNLESLTKWQQRKTLITKSDFDTMLEHWKISSQDFNRGITPPTESSLKKLFNFVQGQNWYTLHKGLFSLKTEFCPVGLEVALRFHVAYYLSKIHSYLEQYDNISFTQSSIESLKEHFISELLLIAKRTLVWDVHDIKERLSLGEDDSEKEFAKYIQLRFGSAYDTELFFLEYPTLSRLLAERLSYAIENFKHFLHSAIESSDRLIKTFQLCEPFVITKWNSQTGDSHNKGKTTTLLEINKIPLAFKYHSNDVLTAFNQFLSYLEEKAPQYNFYKVACISGIDYCFEEFIENESCISTAEIQQYYHNYGLLIAITYLLGSSDLHMENLIAKGTQPVLIDVETLLRAEERRIYTHEYTKNDFFERDSVITSGLLPMSKYWKRQIDVSALNGVKQKLPFTVRKLVNENTSDILYQLEEAYLPSAQNVPLLNELPIPYKDYEEYIIGGYREMLSLLQKNKNEVCKILSTLFHKLPLRILLRDTQDYQNFLDFSTHPSCMVDYTEYEKIFENIWNNAFIQKNIIKHEVAALLRHDIPYFCADTDSLDIRTSEITVPNFYTRSMLQLLKTHANNINEDTASFSFLLLQESLNTLSMDIREIEIPQNNLHIKNDYLRKAADIADLVLEKVRIADDEKMVLWTEVMPYEEQSFILEHPDQNLYNGTSGLFIFLYFMNQLVPSPKYNNILNALENEVLCLPPTKQQHYSAFHGVGARLTAAFTIFRYKKEDKYLNYLQENLKLILNDIENYTSLDWICGKSSLICVLSRIYEEYSIPLAKDILKKLTESISIPHDLEPGFAHGYAGILYSLIRSNSVLKSKDIEEQIHSLYLILLETLQHNQDLNSSWCRGTTGINKALTEFHSAYSSSDRMLITAQTGSHPQNSCLCHGSYGDLSLLIEEAETFKDCLETSIGKIIKSPLFLKSNPTLIPMGLFTGTTGLGLQLLRIVNPISILDILYL